MESAVIIIDGQIELVEQMSTPNQDRSSADRARSSRLNDVMIVLERERATLERGLSERLIAAVSTRNIESLSLSLDEQAPKFSIQMRPATDTEAVQELTASERTTLEAETAAEIIATIQKHAAYGQEPRWQPSLTVVCRRPVADIANPLRTKSIWLRTLFWLLAAIVMGVAYYYVKQSTT